MVAYFPADAPRYTVLTTIETRAQAGKAYYGGPLAGPVVKRMVDYIFNRGRDWYGRVDDGGPRRYPDRMKAATSRRSAAWPTACRPAPRSKAARVGARHGGQPLERRHHEPAGGRGVMPTCAAWG